MPFPAPDEVAAIDLLAEDRAEVELGFLFGRANLCNPRASICTSTRLPFFRAPTSKASDSLCLPIARKQAARRTLTLVSAPSGICSGRLLSIL